jgi:hypothetical protein
LGHHKTIAPAEWRWGTALKKLKTYVGRVADPLNDPAKKPGMPLLTPTAALRPVQDFATLTEELADDVWRLYDQSRAEERKAKRARGRSPSPVGEWAW